MNLGVPNDPKYWQNRAKEAWSIAEQMTDAHTKAVMVDIAQWYEKLFKRAEVLVSADKTAAGSRPLPENYQSRNGES
jgi:hypothetical protein